MILREHLLPSDSTNTILAVIVTWFLPYGSIYRAWSRSGSMALVSMHMSRRQPMLEEASILTNIKANSLPVLAYYWDLEAVNMSC